MNKAFKRLLKVVVVFPFCWIHWCLYSTSIGLNNILIAIGLKTLAQPIPSTLRIVYPVYSLGIYRIGHNTSTQGAYTFLPDWYYSFNGYHCFFQVGYHLAFLIDRMVFLGSFSFGYFKLYNDETRSRIKSNTGKN